MQSIKKLLPIGLLGLLLMSGQTFALESFLPAFPGAEGFGAKSIGGRGGQVIKVTNLNDNGPGSFREAVEAPPRHYANNIPEWETKAEYEARLVTGNKKPRHYPSGNWKNELEDTYVKRLEDTGKRIVVFDVSGIINLDSDLYISYAYMTIAGETSPGGILITGYSTYIQTHDLIMRHMRFRGGTHNVVYERDASGEIVYYDRSGTPPVSGAENCAIGNKVAGKFSNPNTDPTPNVLRKPEYDPCEKTIVSSKIHPYVGPDPSELRPLYIQGRRWGTGINSYNIIIDHSSMSWGVDQTLSLSGGVTDTTVQWSIISEGLSAAGHEEGAHSKGLMVSGKYREDMSITLHHNYVAHNVGRSPLIYNPPENTPNGNTFIVDGRNNITYNWYGGVSPLIEGTDTKTNWIHNYAKRGKNSHSYSFEVIIYSKDQLPTPLVYVSGNIGSTRLDQSSPQWNVGNYYRTNLANPLWQKDTPWSAPAVNTTEMSDAYALEILDNVGATKPVRDSVDTRIIKEFKDGTGSIINNIKYPEDFPTFQDLPAPADNDNDGIADSWEKTQGFNVKVNDSAQDKDNDGYTNIEEYLHYLAGSVSANRPPAPRGFVVRKR